MERLFDPAFIEETLAEILAWIQANILVLSTAIQFAVVAVAFVIAWIAADRFTIAGLGSDTARGLGLNARATFVLGVAIVALVTGITTVTTGVIPFLGLIVPNIASRLVGDNMRRTVPLVAMIGAAMVLACDIVGRLVNFPYEIPLGVVMGILGSVVFLALLLRSPSSKAVARG